MLRSVALATLALLSVALQPASGQAGIKQCDAWCGSHPAECHALKSSVLLDLSHWGNGACSNEFKAEMAGLTRHQELLRSLEEIQLAKGDPQWFAQNADRIHFEIALRQEILGHEALLSEDLQTATKYLELATASYEAAAERTAESKKVGNEDELLEAVIGIIRSGRPIQALRVVGLMDAKSEERLYLTASLYSIVGERRHAGLLFERWLTNGCKSTFPLLTYNELGSRVLLGDPKSASGAPACERLPAELRGQLQDLREDTGHPDNLPAVNFPPELISDRGELWDSITTGAP
jgi:hypothetical protein